MLVQLRAQLDFILKGFVSKLDHLQRDSGVKDKHFSCILEWWQIEAEKCYNECVPFGPHAGK